MASLPLLSNVIKTMMLIMMIFPKSYPTIFVNYGLLFYAFWFVNIRYSWNQLDRIPRQSRILRTTIEQWCVPSERKVPSRPPLTSAMFCKQILMLDGLIAIVVFHNFKGSMVGWPPSFLIPILLNQTSLWLDERKTVIVNALSTFCLRAFCTWSSSIVFVKFDG